MAKFSFPDRSAEEEGISGEGGADMNPPEGRGGGSGSLRRILIIAGIGVVVVGGWLLANQLFLAPSPPPSAPGRLAAPPSPASAPSPAKKEATAAPGDPAKVASKEETKPAAATPLDTAVGKTGAGSATATGKAEPRQATAPTKAGGKPPAIPIAVSPLSFSLQVGAMVMEGNAEALKQKLEAVGFPAVIRKGTAFVTKQVVTVGDMTGRREAEEMSRRLNVDGFPSELLAVGGQYTPQVGAFFNLDEAIDLSRELQKKNYHPKITSKPANTVVYQVRHGRFDSRTAAVNRGDELKSKGFNFLVVRE